MNQLLNYILVELNRFTPTRVRRIVLLSAAKIQDSKIVEHI